MLIKQGDSMALNLTSKSDYKAYAGNKSTNYEAEIDKLKVKPKTESKKSEEIVIGEEIIVDTITTQPMVEEKPVTATDLRSMADKLFKEAQALRKKADEIEPPKSKKKSSVEAG
jgi:hypothetical protein